jgi:FkbM family methyltransferase
VNGSVVYDIGAFEGLLTLFFARRASRVVAYEPNPASRARLVENLALNDVNNVTVRPMGIGAGNGVAELIVDDLMPGGATADGELADQIRSGLPSVTASRIEVRALDDDILENDLPAPDFVKIDIEGMEHAALCGMSRTLRERRPRLFIEMHGADQTSKRANIHRVVDLLWDLGYRCVHHIESDARINSANADTAAEGHLYVRYGDPPQDGGIVT